MASADAASIIVDDDDPMEGAEAEGRTGKPTKSLTKNAKYCCVKGCRRNTVVHAQEVKFFNLPAASTNSDQREKFLKAIKKETKDGSPWNPKPRTAIICSRHFVGGKPSPTKTSPDYYPTRHLGNETSVKPKTEADMARFKRHVKRRFENIGPSTSQNLSTTTTPSTSSATPAPRSAHARSATPTTLATPTTAGVTQTHHVT